MVHTNSFRRSAFALILAWAVGFALASSMPQPDQANHDGSTGGTSHVHEHQHGPVMRRGIRVGGGIRAGVLRQPVSQDPIQQQLAIEHALCTRPDEPYPHELFRRFQVHQEVQTSGWIPPCSPDDEANKKLNIGDIVLVGEESDDSWKLTTPGYDKVCYIKKSDAASSLTPIYKHSDWKDGELQYVELRRAAMPNACAKMMQFGVGHGLINFFYKGQKKGDTIDASAGGPSCGAALSKCGGAIKYFAEGVSRLCKRNHSGADEAMWIRIYPDQFKDKLNLLGEDASEGERWTPTDVKKLFKKNSNAVTWRTTEEALKREIQENERKNNNKLESVKILKECMSERVLWTPEEYGDLGELDVDVGVLGSWVYDNTQEYIDDTLYGAEFECKLSPAKILPSQPHHQHQHQETVTSEESDREHGWIIKTLLDAEGTPYAIINFPYDQRAQATHEYLKAWNLSRGILGMENLAKFYENEDDFQKRDELLAEVEALKANDEATNKQIFADAFVEAKRLEDTKQHKTWRQLVPLSLLDDEHIRLNRSSGESQDFKTLSNNCQDLCLDFYQLLTGLARPKYYDRKKLAVLAAAAGMAGVAGCAATIGVAAGCVGAVACTPCCVTAGAVGCCLGVTAGCMGNQYCELGAMARCGPCSGTERSVAARCFPSCAPDLTNLGANSGIQMTTLQREALEASLREHQHNM